MYRLRDTRYGNPADRVSDTFTSTLLSKPFKSQLPFDYFGFHLQKCISSLFLDMSGSPAVVMRLVASAFTVAEKAGAIVRKVLHTGELGIVEKVG